MWVKARFDILPEFQPYNDLQRTLASTIKIKGSEELSIADRGPDPEAHLLLAEEEHSRTELLAAVRLAAVGLPPDERRYLQAIFSATDPLPPREVARIMGCKVEEVYRLRQRAQRWFAEVADRLEKSECVRLNSGMVT